MESLEKDHSYSENPQQPGVTSEEYAVPALAEVGISHRLRDRELLRKRKAEAEKKDIQQEESKHKRARKGKATGRGRGRRQTLQPEPKPETQTEEAKQQESQVVAAEEEAEVAHGLQGESSAPLLVAESVYPQQDVSPPVLLFGHLPGLEETPRPEDSEEPQSVENDHLDQDLFGSLM